MDRLQLLTIISYLDPLSAVVTVQVLNLEVLHDTKFWLIAQKERFSEELPEEYEEIKSFVKVESPVLNFLSRTLPLTSFPILLPKLAKNKCYLLVRNLISRLEEERDQDLLKVILHQAVEYDLLELVKYLVLKGTEETLDSILDTYLLSNKRTTLEIIYRLSDIRSARRR